MWVPILGIMMAQGQRRLCLAVALCFVLLQAAAPTRARASASEHIGRLSESSATPAVHYIDNVYISGLHLLGSKEADPTRAPYLDIFEPWPPVITWTIGYKGGVSGGGDVRQESCQVRVMAADPPLALTTTTTSFASSATDFDDGGSSMKLTSDITRPPKKLVLAARHGSDRAEIRLSRDEASRLVSDTMYVIHIVVVYQYTVYVSNNATSIDSGAVLAKRISGTMQARRYFRTALLRGAPDWSNASWISGGTMLRSNFTLPTDRGAITAATAYASGVGCYSLEVNGVTVSDEMDPGWATLPSERVLYRAHDVAAHLQSAAAATSSLIMVRLGMCKYGYLNSFCVGAHASTATCRAFRMRLRVHFTDNTVFDFSTNPSTWEATTALNPIRYTHLYHGETYDYRLVQSRFGTYDINNHNKYRPNGGLRTAGGWISATPATFVLAPGAAAVPAEQALGQMSLLPMAPMRATERRKPQSITRLPVIATESYPAGKRVRAKTSKTNCKTSSSSSICSPTANSVGGGVKEGESLTLSCAPGSGTIQSITHAAFGLLNNTLGRFVGGTVGGKCVDPKYPTGCIFYENYKTRTKHFVRSCVTEPCGIDACGAFTQIGAAVASLTDGPEFSCDMVQCANLVTSACASPHARDAVAQLCVNRTSCTLPAKASVLGGPTTCPHGHGTFTPQTRALIVEASGCAPAQPPAPWVFDFGQNMAGACALQLPGPHAVAVGSNIVLKYGETLAADGSVSQPWCKHGGINCANQTDVFIPDPTTPGVQGFTPSFTYHGFRYVQVEGLATNFTPTPAMLTARFVHTDVTPTGSVQFNTSWDILNKIQTAIRYTQLSNLHTHPTDCPTREKRGWTGDSQLTAAEASLNFAMGPLYSNWLRTMADHDVAGCATPPSVPIFPQANVDVCCSPKVNKFGCDFTGVPGGAFANTTGAVADVVPFTNVGGWPGDPSWAIAAAAIPWQVWRASGKLDIVRARYDVATGVVDFLTAQGNPNAGGLVTFGYYGDWLSLEKVAHAQVTGWSHLRAISYVLDMARALQRTADVTRYTALLAKLKVAYHKQYWDPAGLTYRGGSQTANLLPLLLDIPPPDCRVHAAAKLTASFIAHENATTSGIVGTSFLLEALNEVGRDDLALEVALRTSYPSWGHMVLQGPGTIWEAWNGGTSSQNHPALAASIGPYLYRLAGLHSPSWKTPLYNDVDSSYDDVAAATMEFQPSRAAVARLGSASVRVQTPAGIAALSWSAGGGRLELNATVPLNSPISTAAAAKTREGGRPSVARLHLYIPPDATTCQTMCVRYRQPPAVSLLSPHLKEKWELCATGYNRGGFATSGSSGAAGGSTQRSRAADTETTAWTLIPGACSRGVNAIEFTSAEAALMNGDAPVRLHVSGGMHQAVLACC